MAWSDVYERCVEEIAAVAGDLGPDDLGRRVLATPEWTVHQLLAHLAGGARDVVTGRMDDAPQPAWTARHVAERADTSAAGLLTELQAQVALLTPMLQDNPRPAIVWDIAVHLADLHETLGLGIAPSATWEPVLDAVLPPGAREELGLEDAVPDYELFRGRFSRRSRAQLRSWGLPGTAIETFGVFGVREDDQPVP